MSHKFGPVYFAIQQLECIMNMELFNNWARVISREIQALSFIWCSYFSFSGALPFYTLHGTLFSFSMDLESLCVCVFNLPLFSFPCMYYQVLSSSIAFLTSYVYIKSMYQGFQWFLPLIVTWNIHLHKNIYSHKCACNWVFDATVG